MTKMPKGTAEEAREKLAAYAHTAWSGMMNYLFSKCERVGIDDLMVIPDWAVERWKRQAATSYSAMPENERESDQAEADTILAIIQSYVTAAVAEERERIRKVVCDVCKTKF